MDIGYPASDDEKLHKAARLIDEVVRGIDVQATTCTCCNRPTFHNWAGKMRRDALQPMAEKLRRIAKYEAQVPS